MPQQKGHIDIHAAPVAQNLCISFQAGPCGVFRDEATLCFKRDFFSTAYDLEIDKQFRIVLPPILREYAGLEKDIITVGMGTRLEIWDKQAWEDYRQQTQVPAEKKRAVLAGMVL